MELEGLSCAKDYAKRCLLGFTRGAALVAINAVLDEVDGKCDPSHAAHRRELHVNLSSSAAANNLAMCTTFHGRRSCIKRLGNQAPREPLLGEIRISVSLCRKL